MLLHELVNNTKKYDCGDDIDNEQNRGHHEQGYYINSRYIVLISGECHLLYDVIEGQYLDHLDACCVEHSEIMVLYPDQTVSMRKVEEDEAFRLIWSNGSSTKELDIDVFENINN